MRRVANPEHGLSVLVAGAVALIAPACAQDAEPTETAVPSRDVTVQVADESAVAEVSERYLSVAVDTAEVVGAPFWSASGEMSLIGSERHPPYDFTRPRLRRLAAELAPAWLRIGGSTADKTWYALDAGAGTTAPAPYDEVLTAAEVDALGAFARELGFEVMFTLNAGPGPRDAEGRWSSEQASLLLQYTKTHDVPVGVWELGNEINGYALLLGPSHALTGAQYAQDFLVARALLDSEAPSALLAGPSSAYWPVAGEQIPILDDFLEGAGQSVDIVTWHYYPQQSRRCPIALRRAGPEVMLDPANLDEVDIWAQEVESARAKSAPSAPVWLGESGNAQCGGEPGVSDAFAGGFWWLDQLGRMARRGQAVSVRQTLSGSNYGLLDEDTLEPNPDYWNSILWRRLMGTRVLDTVVSAEPYFRTYGHCTPTSAGLPGGAVTLLALNLDQQLGARLTTSAPWAGARLAYVLTADALDARELRLNGVPLVAGADGALPDLSPVPIQPGEALVLPALSYGFFVFPDADAAACR